MLCCDQCLADGQPLPPKAYCNNLHCAMRGSFECWCVAGIVSKQPLQLHVLIRPGVFLTWALPSMITLLSFPLLAYNFQYRIKFGMKISLVMKLMKLNTLHQSVVSISRNRLQTEQPFLWSQPWSRKNTIVWGESFLVFARWLPACRGHKMDLNGELHVKIEEKHTYTYVYL